MKKILIAAVVVLGLALAGSIYYCFTLNQDNNALTAELHSTRSELAATRTELDTTNHTLVSTRTELDTTKDTLSSTRSELSSARDTLDSTRLELDTTNQTLASRVAELNSANAQLTLTQKSLTTLQDSVSTTQQQLAAAQDTLKGLGITVSASRECWDVQLVDNVTAKNPTWKELMTFLAADQTEKHAYIQGVYDCSQFSRDVHNNAEAAGIRAAEVQVTFEGEYTGHALDAFITTDYGLVYIDCTTSPDTIAWVKSGKEYRSVNVRWVPAPKVISDSWWESQPVYFYIPGGYGGHVVTSSIRIFW